jgi:DNA invertase Pin-like site-specific DNA recombinase
LRLEKNVQKLNDELKAMENKRNERGAGRKPKITAELCEDIRKRRKAGEKYRAIAENLNLSVGLVHKAFNSSVHNIINEQ